MSEREGEHERQLLGEIEIYHENNPSNPYLPFAALNPDTMDVAHGGTPAAAVERMADRLNRYYREQVD